MVPPTASERLRPAKSPVKRVGARVFIPTENRDLCDTLLATRTATLNGHILFAKNSDRERNEAQALEILPRAEHPRGSRVRLTYIEIDQAPVTFSCLISRPFWMWGAEMGANEHGVVIGNEAMHSWVPAPRRRALTGMDLVRLALERAATAREALDVIAALLDRHGQGGDCGHLQRFYYHNGFVIADAHEAYVLETVGRWWAAERVAGVRTLSNALSIGDRPYALSEDLKAHAARQGWMDEQGRFDFAERLLDPVRDAATFGRGRQARAAELLKARAGRIALADMQAVLRDHGEEAENDPDWSPSKTLRRSICMHAASGPRRSQTVGSMASDLTPGRSVHWVTGAAAPCLSLFKPVVLSARAPDLGAPPTDLYDPQSLWWRHERLHRAALRDFPAALALICEERDALEAGFRAKMASAWAAGRPSVDEAVRGCWTEAALAEGRWAAALAARSGARQGARDPSAARAWSRLNAKAGFPR